MAPKLYVVHANVHISSLKCGLLKVGIKTWFLQGLDSSQINNWFSPGQKQSDCRPSLDVTSVQNLEGGFLDLFSYGQNRWSGWGVAQW